MDFEFFRGQRLEIVLGIIAGTSVDGRTLLDGIRALLLQRKLCNELWVSW